MTLDEMVVAAPPTTLRTPPADGGALWPPTGAQLAVDLVAAVMAGQPRADVDAELRHWLARRDATLQEPVLASVVDAIAAGCRTLVLPRTARGRALDPGAGPTG